jgi:hypothetical protein
MRATKLLALFQHFSHCLRVCVASLLLSLSVFVGLSLRKTKQGTEAAQLEVRAKTILARHSRKDSGIFSVDVKELEAIK